jgi:hypothetical protein
MNTNQNQYCPRCKEPKEPDKYKHCEKCRNKEREYRHKFRDERVADCKKRGVCHGDQGRCQREVDDKKFVCSICRKKAQIGAEKRTKRWQQKKSVLVADMREIAKKSIVQNVCCDTLKEGNIFVKITFVKDVYSQMTERKGIAISVTKGILSQKKNA